MPRLSSIPQILCEIASQIQLSEYKQTKGIVALHDYSWKIETNEADDRTVLILEKVPEDLQNALSVF
jgi:hypothetical protein